MIFTTVIEKIFLFFCFCFLVFQIFIQKDIFNSNNLYTYFFNNNKQWWHIHDNNISTKQWIKKSNIYTYIWKQIQIYTEIDTNMYKNKKLKFTNIYYGDQDESYPFLEDVWRMNGAVTWWQREERKMRLLAAPWRCNEEGNIVGNGGVWVQ